MFSTLWPLTNRVAHAIRESSPSALLVLGGEHGTAVPEHVLGTSPFDVVVLGEGEETFVELLRAHEQGRPLSDVKGIAFRRGRAAGDQRAVGAEAGRGRHPVARLGRVSHHRVHQPAPDERHQPRAFDADPRHPRMPVPVHVLLEPRHVDAALDRPRPGGAGRRDGALRSQVPREQLRLPGPDGHREAPVDRGLLPRADRPRPEDHLADAERHPGRGLRRRGGRSALPVGLPGAGLRAGERLARDPQDRPQAGRPGAHAGCDGRRREARAEAVLLHRHRVS